MCPFAFRNILKCLKIAFFKEKFSLRRHCQFELSLFFVLFSDAGIPKVKFKLGFMSNRVCEFLQTFHACALIGLKCMSVVLIRDYLIAIPLKFCSFCVKGSRG